MSATFPIMDNILLDSVPFGFMAPHEEWAQRNHSQSLKQLAARGGLSACEALAVIEGREWRRMDVTDAGFQLINKVREWRATAPTKAEGASK